MITAVVVSYKLPLKRLAEWITYNEPLFTSYKFKAVIVVDSCPIDFAPPWVKIVKYPVDLNPFNLSACKNFGIRKVNDGIIISTDIDVKLTNKFCDSLQELTTSEFLMGKYHQIKDWETGDLSSPTLRAMGTVAAFAGSWNKIRGYDERFVGYGADDAVPINAFVDIGLSRAAEAPVYHVEHPEKWNATTINPLNREANQQMIFNSKEEWRLHPRSNNWGSS